MQGSPLQPTPGRPYQPHLLPPLPCKCSRQCMKGGADTAAVLQCRANKWQRRNSAAENKPERTILCRLSAWRKRLSYSQQTIEPDLVATCLQQPHTTPISGPETGPHATRAPKTTARHPKQPRIRNAQSSNDAHSNAETASKAGRNNDNSSCGRYSTPPWSATSHPFHYCLLSLLERAPLPFVCM